MSNWQSLCFDVLNKEVKRFEKARVLDHRLVSLEGTMVVLLLVLLFEVRILVVYKGVLVVGVFRNLGQVPSVIWNWRNVIHILI
jgi:hypothetical protein